MSAPLHVPYEARSAKELQFSGTGEVSEGDPWHSVSEQEVSNRIRCKDAIPVRIQPGVRNDGVPSPEQLVPGELY